MATPQELLALLGARQVAGTSLHTMGGRPPGPQRRVQPQQPAPQPQARSAVQSRLSQLAAMQPEPQPTPQGGGGGWKGGLGKVLGAAMKPLDVLQTPQRAVLLGLEGMAKQGALDLDKVFDMDAIRADDRSIGEKLKDSSYSFDDLTKSTGNRVADFGLNFAGDVATDPLTYVTLGSTAVAGKGARMGLAARAAEKGLGDEVVRKAAKGASFLSKNEREILGIEQAGLRFAGGRVPGTGGLATGLGRATGTIRHGITSSRPWQVISRKPEGLEEAYRVLETGAGRMSPTSAASLVGWDEAYRSTMKTVAATHGPQVAEIFRGVDENARRGLTHATESGQDQTLRPFLDQLLGEARSAGIPIGKIENYLPHVWSREGRGFLQGVKLTDNERAVIDLTAESGVNLQRQLKGGVIHVNGKEVDIGNGTIAEINAALSKEFPDAPVERWLEDDAAVLMSTYINGVASDIGEVKAFDRLLQSRAGVANPLDDVSDEVIDRVATRTANKQKRDALKETLAIRREAYKEEQKLARVDATQLQGMLVARFTAEAEKYGTIGANLARTLRKPDLKGLDVEAKALGKQVVAARQSAQRQLDALEARWYEIEEEIAAAQVRLSNAPSQQERLAQYNTLVQQRMRLAQEIEDGKAAVAEIEKLTEELTSVIQMSRRLREMGDNPDEVQAFAQELVPAREVEVTRLTEGPPAPIVDQTAQRLRAVDDRIEALSATLTDDAAAEAGSLERTAGSFDEALTEARQVTTELEAAVDDATRKVAQAQARRGVKPNAKIAAALGGLADELNVQKQMYGSWRDESRSLWEASTAESIANREVRNLVESRDIMKAKGRSLENRALRLQGRDVVEDGQTLPGMQFDWRTGTPESVQAQAQAQIDKAVQKNITDAVSALRTAWIAEQELVEATARRAAARRAATVKPDEQPMKQLAEMDVQRSKIDAARAKVDEAMAALPPSEANLVKTLDALKTAQEKVRRLEGVSRNITRQQERVARVSTPERQVAALKEVRQLLARQVEANQAYKARPTETFTELVREELPSKAALEAERAALPSTAKIAPPAEVRAAIEKVQIKGKVTARDVRRGKFVSNDVLKTSPREIAQEYVSIVKGLRENPSIAEAAEQQAVIDRAVTLAEFMLRHDGAVKAGAEAGDELAARVTREVLDSQIARTSRRHERMAAAVDAVEDSPKRLKELKTSFADKMFEQADRLDTAIKRRQALDHVLKKQGGADVGQGARPRRQVLQEDFGIESRAELVALAREANENVDAERRFFNDMLKYLTGSYWDEEATTIRNTLRMVKPKGSDFNDKQLTGRAYAQVEKLWKSTTPEARAGLMQDMVRSVQRDQRELTALRAQRTALGGGEADITADWKDVLLGRQGEGTVQGKAEKIDEQLGLYGQAEGAIQGAREDLSGYNAQLQGAIRAQTPAAERLPQAEAELGKLPRNIREQRYTEELDAMSDVIKGERAQGQVNEQIDRVEAALGQLDQAAAKEYAAIDQRRAAQQFLADAQADWQKNAVNRAAKMKANAKKVEALKPAKADVNKTFEQLDELVKAAPDSPELQPALALHAAFNDRMTKMARMDADIKLQEAFLDLARKSAKKASKDPTKNFHNVFMREAEAGWEHVAQNLLTKEHSIAVRTDIAAGLRRLKDVSENGDLYKAIEQLTRFFKTYATATPGFHVRNAMSASFMNMTDGVKLKDFGEAMAEWPKFKADPVKYMEGIKESDPQLYDAWKAVFGSGAHGSFDVAELGGTKGSKALHNVWTNTSRKWGSAVETTARLAAAINSTRGGADVYGALNRVTRLHFDYSQLSKLDKRIKLMIPFWTFMSRNLPLQLQQIAMRPRLYTAYDHLRDNASVDVEGAVLPEWLQNRDPIVLGGSAEGGVHTLAPDLPHINLMEDYAALSPTNPLRALGQLNPMFTAPVEAAANTNFYYGSPIGSPGDRLNHLASKTVPPVAMAQRLAGLGRYAGKETEKRANFAGVPYYGVTPEMMQAEMRRRAYQG